MKQETKTIFKFIVVIALGLIAQSLIYIFRDNITTSILGKLLCLAAFLIPIVYLINIIAHIWVDGCIEMAESEVYR